jgi:hypothetical protein
LLCGAAANFIYCAVETTNFIFPAAASRAASILSGEAFEPHPGAPFLPYSRVS